MSKLDALIDSHEQMKRQFQIQAQELFKELAKEFWDKNPGLTAVKWVQYTPYFNDGDACEFGIGEITFTNAPEDELENISSWGEYEGENEDIFACTNVGYVIGSDREYHKQERDALLKLGDKIDPASCDEFSNAVSQLDSVMLAMFGDHAQITMTRDGFDVDEYLHD
jgi:hypothetical protein